jgi:hypothetical protein
MVPSTFKLNIPAEYANLPQLQGRAEVEMVLKKGQPGEKFEIKGKLYDDIKVLLCSPLATYLSMSLSVLASSYACSLDVLSVCLSVY